MISPPSRLALTLCALLPAFTPALAAPSSRLLSRQIRVTTRRRRRFPVGGIAGIVVGVVVLLIVLVILMVIMRRVKARKQKKLGQTHPAPINNGHQQNQPQMGYGGQEPAYGQQPAYGEQPAYGQQTGFPTQPQQAYQAPPGPPPKHGAAQEYYR